MDPAQQLQSLVEIAANFDLDDSMPVRRYCRSASELDRMAKVHLAEGNYKDAFVMWMKIAILLVERLPKHSGYKLMTQKERVDSKKLCEAAMVNAEKLKKSIKVRLEKEFEILKQEEAKRQAEEVRLHEEKLKGVEASEGASLLHPAASSTQHVSRGHEETDHSADYRLIALGDFPQLPALTQVDHTSAVPLHAREVQPAAPLINLDYKTAADKVETGVNAIPTIDRSRKPDTYLSRQDSEPLDGNRKIFIPPDIISRFLALASSNTRQNLETCGILAGKLARHAFQLTHVLIPKQTASPDSCTTEGEEDLFDAQDKYDLVTLGWIHTHPSQTSFLSSVDLHTQCSYQQLMPEAIAIVCAPKYNQTGIYRLTPNYGLKFITACRQTGFHPHPKEPPLFEESPLVSYDPSLSLQIIDLR